MKSIKTKLVVYFGTLVGIMCIGLGLISYINSLDALKSNLKVLLPEVAEETAEEIRAKLDGELKALESIAAREDMKDPNISLDAKLKILSKEGERIGALRMGIVSPDGNLINADGSTGSLKDREYFQKAMGGKSVAADPAVAEEIRTLAEQSRVSSENISKVVAGISRGADSMMQNSVTMDNELLNQVTVIEKSLGSFKKIIVAIDEIIPKIETIQSQAQDIEEDKNQVMSRIEGISSVSMEVSASAEEISASSEEMSASVEEVASAASMLNNATDQMLEEVERFKV